jgi:hypothetical protein
MTLINNALGISVAYERTDTQDYRVSTFNDWNAALVFARWVDESPELNLLNLQTTAAPSGLS